ncbi:hypothetical protein AB0I98_31585 [Streptomyces sp. NPDC050211]|uniref:hypothetical protein n=1 Tax=Streptomyces sp. NPDC050211 TaxID=3154932 RepID=UPI0034424D44
MDEGGTVLQVAAGFVRGGPLIWGQARVVGLGADGCDGCEGVTGQDPGGFGAHPVFGGGIGGGVETPRSRPAFFPSVFHKFQLNEDK